MRKMTDLINLFVAIAAAAAVVLRIGWEEAAGGLRSILFEGGTSSLVFLCALAVIVVNVYNELRCGKEECGGGRHLDVASENGVNRISVSALESQLLDEIKGEGDVFDPQISLRVKGEGLPARCEISFKLKKQSNVTGRTDQLKKKVAESFTRMIPSGPGIELVANVLDLVADSSGKPASSSNDTFSGPVYSAYEQSNGDDADEA